MRELTKINKELKIYINEASFISQKCRNKLLRIFADTFKVDLDISNYKNVDIEILDDYTILYRDDKYIPKEEIKSKSELQEKYQKFKNEADDLIRKKDIDFDSLKLRNNIINLIVLVGLFIFVVVLILFLIRELLIGNYYQLLWFIVFILPVIIPDFLGSLSNRIIQARKFLKSLFHK